MIARFGTSEINVMWRARDDGKGFVVPSKRACDTLCINAGFFPNDKKLMIKYADLMKESTRQADLMGIWHVSMEEYELKTYGNNPEFCNIRYLEPFFAKNPWTKALKHKKVLVIYPFAKTIESQYYSKRKLLFENQEILPEFELITQQAVQTIAGNKDERFRDWFDALDYMYNEAMSKDFDVAIIGCGAYGFPLAAKIKQAGKVAIHLGGSVQHLFGITGKRIERLGDERYLKLINEHWVRPSQAETPKNIELVEDGVYW